MIKRIKKTLSTMKLWQKLLLLYLSVSVIPLMCITLYTTFSTVKLATTQTSTRLSEITNNVGNNIDRNFKTANDIIEPQLYSDSFLISANKYIASPADSQDIKAHLGKLKDQLSVFFGQSVKTELLLPDGAVADSSHIYHNAVDFKEQIAVFGENGTHHITCNSKTVSVYYRVSNLYRSGQDIGILKFSVEASQFIGTLLVDGIDEYIFVIQDSNGQTIYLDAHTKNNYGNFVLNILKRTDDKTVRIRDDVYIYHPLYMDELDWNLCVLIPRAVLYQNFPEILTYCILISVICLILVGFFSVISSLSLSKRINNISSDMVLVSEGQLEGLSLNTDAAGDEIGQLSVLFHHMIDRINSLVIEQYKNEIKSKEEQLKILQNQINPHFLYNCMDTINWRCIMNNDHKTSKFAYNLASFYRTCLNKGNTRIGINDEFRNIRAYIYLQQDMHDDSFDYTEEINPEIYEYECINLMLQPIVENALEHGIETKGTERGRIHISADFDSPEKDRISIKIINTGKPIEQSVADAVMRGERGYGLSNVTNRIRLYFGQEYGISIAPKENGTVCTIHIPAKRWSD